MSALLTGPDQHEAPRVGARRATPVVERRLDLAWRVAAIVLAAVCAAVGWPALVCAPLAAVATVATVSALSARRRRGWIDALLVGVAGLLMALVGLGLLLDRFPAGLTRLSWAVAAGVFALAAVVWSWSRPAPYLSVPGTNGFVARGARPRLTGPGLLWYGGAAVLVVVAIAISVHATRIANRPPLQLSVLSSTSTSATANTTSAVAVVEVSAGPSAGRYVLVVRSGTSTSTVGPFALHAGQTVRYRIPVGSRGTVSLRAADAVRNLRTVVVGGT